MEKRRCHGLLEISVYCAQLLYGDMAVKLIRSRFPGHVQALFWSFYYPPARFKTYGPGILRPETFSFIDFEINVILGGIGGRIVVELQQLVFWLISLVLILIIYSDKVVIFIAKLPGNAIFSLSDMEICFFLFSFISVRDIMSVYHG